MSNNSETDSEISLSVFDVRSSDEESTTANAGFLKQWVSHKWNSKDEDDVPEVQTVSPIKTNETQTVKTKVDKIDQTSQKQGIGFKKIKACFVCKSIDHLIKDFNFHDKQSQEPKMKTVVNTGVLTRTGLITPVKQNEKRAVHKVSTARPVSTTRPVSTARPISTARPVSTARPGSCSGDSDELKFNLFSVSQMCDKKNSVLFTESECLILSHSFKLLDESQVELRAPRNDDVYNLDLKNIIPSRDLVGCDNGTEFNNHAMNELCAKKKIKREFSVAKTLQQNGFAERKNMTLIEAARPMIMLLGYSTTSKAFRVYNKRTKRVEENLHINFLEDQPNVTGTGPNWMFDLDFLTNSINYILVSVEIQVNVDAALDDATRQAFEEEKRNIASQKRAAQTTSITKLSTGRSSVSTATTPYVSAASTSTGANAGESSFVYLGGKTNLLADFNNMDDTINVSPIPTLRIHKKHPKDQILGDPKSAVQTRRQFKSFLQHRQALQQPDGIFIIVGIILADILKKFDFWSIRTATTPIESNKPLVKDEDVKMFQVTPKASYLNAVKRIFRFLKHQPKLGLWYPTDSPFELEAFSATTVCGEYYGYQRSMMDYGFNFMNTKIHIDNESTISVIKNHVAHSRTKHIEIRFHFIRDCFEKRLLEVIKIHTDHNVADLLTKGFDVTRFNFCPVVSTTFVEQFWMSAKSKIINNVRYITAKVAGKPVNISEASIRSDLLFYDADGIDSLHNQAIFDVIQLMGHLDAKKKFVMYPRLNQLKNVLVPLNHFHINALTTKVFSFMVKKGKSFSGNVTPLFPSMLAQPTEDECAVLERPSETQPTPSPPYLSADQHETQPDPSPRPSPTIPILDSIPEGSCGNHRGQSSSDRSLSGNEDDLRLQSIKQLKKKAKPVISHHNAWIKSVSINKILARKKSLKKKWMQKESVYKQGRKSAKSTPTAHTDQVFDDVDEVSTAKPKEVEVSTDKLDEGTAEPKDGTSDESTAPITVFRDDETIAEFLVSMSQNKAKQKGVEIKDVEDLDRPRATSTRSVLTFKPLPKIDPKDKGKKVLEKEVGSDAESEGVDEAERKFDQLAKDEEIARKVQDDWEAEEEMKKLAEEEATKAALIQDFNDIHARIEDDRLLAARLQEEEREAFTVEERVKFLYDTIAAQRRFIA
ncbi:putative ribonuclease H-like domain-containing protein [Tanacetum coccineum]|uniref:Ribonuclease H-like domain-containing protein n=1 Tax=Tanacetum coccineum TaxID=301880 RepID=A0ABQ5DRK6_9ASTR